MLPGALARQSGKGGGEKKREHGRGTLDSRSDKSLATTAIHTRPTRKVVGGNECEQWCSSANAFAALLVVDLGDDLDHEGAEKVEGTEGHAGAPPWRAIRARVRARRSRISAPCAGRTTE